MRLNTTICLRIHVISQVAWVKRMRMKCRYGRWNNLNMQCNTASAKIADWRLKSCFTLDFVLEKYLLLPLLIYWILRLSALPRALLTSKEKRLFLLPKRPKAFGIFRFPYSYIADSGIYPNNIRCNSRYKIVYLCKRGAEPKSDSMCRRCKSPPYPCA